MGKRQNMTYVLFHSDLHVGTGVGGSLIGSGEMG